MEVVFDEFIFVEWLRIISTFMCFIYVMISLVVFGKSFFSFYSFCFQFIRIFIFIVGSFLNEEQQLLDVERKKFDIKTDLETETATETAPETALETALETAPETALDTASETDDDVFEDWVLL